MTTKLMPIHGTRHNIDDNHALVFAQTDDPVDSISLWVIDLAQVINTTTIGCACHQCAPGEQDTDPCELFNRRICIAPQGQP